MNRSSSCRAESELRSRFAQINASWAIEGQIVDEADLAMQERIIRGEITAQEAIDELKDRYAIPCRNS